MSPVVLEAMQALRSPSMRVIMFVGPTNMAMRPPKFSVEFPDFYSCKERAPQTAAV